MKFNKEITLLTAGVTCLTLYLLLLDNEIFFDTAKNEEDEEEEDQTPKQDQYDEFVPSKPKAKKPLIKNIKKKDKRSFYQRLQEDFETTQVTLTNLSNVSREVRLWAGNKKPPISLALDGEVGKHSVKEVSINTPLGQAIYPQGMVVNPFNGYTYIANQLSNNISILNSNGTLISLIAVSSNSPFGASPVDLTVNDFADSPNYGTVYVANLIGDTIAIINPQLEFVGTIAVGKRPIAIAFNPLNENVYVANISEDSVSIIDTNSQTVIDTILVGNAPRDITVNTNTGEVYVLNSQSNSITVLTSDNQISTTLENIGNGLTNAAYQPITNKLYVVASQENSVIPIDLNTNTIETSIPTGNDPYAILFNDSTELIYVGNRGDDSYTVIDSNDTVADTLFLGQVGNAIAFNNESETIFSTNALTSSINFITYNGESDKVLVNEGYFAKREDFTFQPALIEHVKFVLSGEERFTVLKLEEETVTGTTKVTPVSFSSYQNPQNFGNVAEVFEMKDNIIDGKNGWNFRIGALQTITILTYYKQFEKEPILNKIR